MSSRWLFPILFTFFVLLGYSVSGFSADIFEAEPLVIEPLPKQVTDEGANRQAIFVDNNSILYISSNRRYHSDPQIYFLDLKTGREKRVTYQRGQMINGLWLDKENKIIYASSTDEDVETPPLLQPYLERKPASLDGPLFGLIPFNSMEIYVSKINGDDVQRLTHNMGFDAFPAYSESDRKLYFSRLFQGHINIFTQSFNAAASAWRVVKTAGHDLGLQLSPDQNQFVWFRFSPDFKSSQILLADAQLKNETFLTLDSGIHWSPSWHPKAKRILFSAKRAPSSHYDIFEVDLEQGCERQLTDLQGDEFFPAVSPDGKTLMFTANFTGQEQIHQKPYVDSNCPSEETH
ncbi:MAG: PD40 domain-containing protein [Bdellovibrionales bacterium]|nr:PD40 domain-containing protein [Bdellovibrionales bacterium]